MCGIAGSVRAQESVERAVVESMLRTVMHRGPDATGVFAAGLGAVGQNRLSIIDLVTGDPPMTTPDGQIGAVLNGEIYGFDKIRGDLMSRGHAFRSHGDTEVIAHLAEDHSPVDLARCLDGMFAFAVWDASRARLVLGRDRFGKKPLYYWTDGIGVVFASEIKAVLAHPAVDRRLDTSAIPAYLAFGYVPTPRTFYEGIRSLPPGHVLVADGAGVVVERYWSTPVAGVAGVERLDVSPSQAAAMCRDVLGKAVERRLVSDRPLGAFLSGGIDSSAVVALMAEHMAEPVRTFTIGFDDSDYDERRWADLVARRFGTKHTTFVVDPSNIDLFEQLLWHFDQPFADSSALPTFLLSELTAGEVTVALSGDGGDEVFAGYERLAAAVVAEKFARLPAAVRSTAGQALAFGGRAGRLAKAARFVDRAGLGLPDALRSWISYVPDDIVDALLPRTDDWAVDDYAAIWASSAGASTLHRVLDLNIRTYLLDDLLPKVDRTSMAHGLEVRAPFLDPAVVELGLRLPPRFLVRGRSLKWVLKRAMRGTLPDEILKRGKRGFGVPLARWFRADLQVYIADRLGPSSPLRSHLHGDTIDRLLSEHRTGSADRAFELWSLLQLDGFLRREGW